MTRLKRYSFFLGFGLACSVLLSGSSALAHPQQQVNETKGQTQLKGGLVKFGEVYSLKGGWNVQVLKVAYSLDYFPCYTDIFPRPDKKLVVIDFAIKNATPSEKFFNTDESLFTLVDSDGNKYTWNGVQLSGNGNKGFAPTLKPGQGMGQTALKMPLRCVFQVPLEAKITKIMTNVGRLNKSEDTLRFLMAGTDSLADPSNKIAPLPKGQGDPNDATGVVAAPIGNATIGTAVPAAHFLINLTSVTISTDAIAPGMFPDDGKKFVIAVFTSKNIGPNDSNAWDWIYENPSLKDSNGSKVNPYKIWNASSATDAVFEHYDQGDQRTYRLIYQIDAGATPSKIQMNTGTCYCWQWDVSTAK